MWDLTTCPFQTSTAAPLEFVNRYVISFHTLLGMWLLIRDGIKVDPCLGIVAPKSVSNAELLYEHWIGAIHMQYLTFGQAIDMCIYMM